MESGDSSSQGFTGTVNLQLTDLIQMVCLSRSDLMIRIKSAKGTGSIRVKAGQIMHAVTDTLEGETAFFEMLGWKDGQFEMAPSQENAFASIDKPWEHLILEAVRQRDEEQGSSERELDEWDLEIEAVMSPPEPESQDEITEAGLEKLRVLIVEDSPLFAKGLRRMLHYDPSIEVVGIAGNGRDALEVLAGNQQVDLITLDIQMPVMQGDTALKHIMIRHAIPTVIVSGVQSQYLDKIFEFLQLGAVDFMWKPEAGEELEDYGNHLRDLVKSAGRATVSRFRRWRKSRAGLAVAVPGPGEPAGDRILVIVGAEGAYMDWFRIPLGGLCRTGLVVGLQKLPEQFLKHFCRLICDNTAVEVKPLPGAGSIGCGRVHLGSGCARVGLRLDADPVTLGIDTISRDSLAWIEGVELWLDQLAEQARDRLNIYLLSGAHPLPAALVQKLIGCGARFILSPRNAVMCTDLIDSVEPFAGLQPHRVIRATPEDLTEVWLKDGSYA